MFTSCGEGCPQVVHEHFLGPVQENHSVLAKEKLPHHHGGIFLQLLSLTSRRRQPIPIACLTNPSQPALLAHFLGRVIVRSNPIRSLLPPLCPALEKLAASALKMYK